MESGAPLQRSEALGIGAPIIVEAAAAIEVSGTVAGVDIGAIGDRILPKPDDLKPSESPLKTQTLTGRGQKVLRVGNLLAGAAGVAFGTLLLLGLASNPIGWGVALTALVVGLSMAGIAGGKRGFNLALASSIAGFVAGVGIGLAAATASVDAIAIGITLALCCLVFGSLLHLVKVHSLELTAKRINQIATLDGGTPADKDAYKRAVKQLGDTSKQFVMVSDTGQLQTVSKARYNLEKVQAQLRTFSGIDEAVVDHQILKLIIKGIKEESANPADASKWLDSGDLQKLTSRLTGDLQTRISPILDSQTQASDRVEALEAILLDHYVTDLQTTIEAQVEKPTRSLEELPVEGPYQLVDDLNADAVRTAVKDLRILKEIRGKMMYIDQPYEHLIDTLSPETQLRVRPPHPDRWVNLTTDALVTLAIMHCEAVLQKWVPQQQVAETYFNQGEAATNPSTKVFYYALGAKLGHPECVAKLGDCYRKGIGVKKDLAMALGFYDKLKNSPEVTARYLQSISEEQDPNNLQLLAQKAKDRNQPFIEFQALAGQCALQAPESNISRVGQPPLFHIVKTVKKLQELVQHPTLGKVAQRALLAAEEVANKYLRTVGYINHGCQLLEALKPEKEAQAAIYKQVLDECWEKGRVGLLDAYYSTFSIMEDPTARERAFWCKIDSLCLCHSKPRFERDDIVDAYNWMHILFHPSPDLASQLAKLARIPPPPVEG